MKLVFIRWLLVWVNYPWWWFFPVTISRERGGFPDDDIICCGMTTPVRAER